MLLVWRQAAMTTKERHERLSMVWQWQNQSLEEAYRDRIPSLEGFGIECLRCRNLQALKFRTEAIGLTYSLMLETNPIDFWLSLKCFLAFAMN